ncbi:MAG: cyanophycinase, partial [Pirellulaceae bacterium]|nr:cyanophycinase [Pirellulaceae bacterium]
MYHNINSSSFLTLVLSLLCFAWDMSNSSALAVEQNSPNTRGHLVIIGGGLRRDNQPIFKSLIEFAGGTEKARFVVLPTASFSQKDSHLFCEELGAYGLSADRAEVLDVTEQNAAQSTHDPAILEKVRRATGLFISGGDQRRLARALTTRLGGDTPLLAEFRALLSRGGVIGGTSAGASIQSEMMLAVSGLPDRMIDEGFDTLNYGITADSRSRGLLITKGFGFFQGGIIDQHFYSFRGRLGRLVRAVDHCRVPYGFGIDENTALIVEPTGRCRVQGDGFVTVIQTKTQGSDGPLGYKINDVWLSALSNGDTFDPTTRQITVAAEKPVQPIGKAEYSGNFLVSDINARDAGLFAIISGLAENQKNRLEAVSLKYHPDWTHGYRFSFTKRPGTQTYVGIMNHSWTYSLLDLRLDISPIAGGLKPAQSQVPGDLPDEPTISRALTAVAMRGLLVADTNLRFRPLDLITRGELASAGARSTHLHWASPQQT